MEKIIASFKIFIISALFVSCSSYQLASYYSDNDGIYVSNERGAMGEIEYWLTDWSMFKSKVMNNSNFDIATGIARIILTIPVGYLTIKFFAKDVWKLASIKH